MLSLKPILVGVSVITGGFLIWSLIHVLTAHFADETPNWIIVTLFALQIVVPIASGFVGAHSAPANPIINATVATFIGVSALILLLTIFTRAANPNSYITSIGVILLLSLIGGLFAVHVWPRR